jgi:RNA polymerase sigma-70 factor (ECF subfamily)
MKLPEDPSKTCSETSEIVPILWGVSEDMPPRLQEAREDESLVLKAQGGDRKAFQRLLVRHGEAVRTFLGSQLAGDPGAEDLYQDSCLRAYRAISDCREPAKFRAWFLGIARHRCQEWFRERRSVPPPLPEDFAAPDQIPLDLERHEALQQALAKIDPEIRVVLRLRHIEGFSCVDIARRLSRPQGTVTSQLSRAYADLRRALGPLWRNPQ